MRCLIIVIFIGFSSAAVATAKNLPIKDYGVQGHTFAIEEQSLLEVIHQRLARKNDSEIKKLQQQFQNRVKAKISNPNPVLGIIHTQKARVFYFDPTYVQDQEITDHEGQLIIAKGTTINPLTKMSWGEPLIFIDGDNAEQVHFAINYGGRIVLVKGSPLILNKKHKTWFYFDQAGLLTAKFGIKQVPAIVSQEHDLLKIEELEL